MSVNATEATAANDRSGGNTGHREPGDACEASAVPSTAEVSEGIASLPSPNKTGPGKLHAVSNFLDDTPPWVRQSFLGSPFNISSFQEDVRSPVPTGGLTPGLRRLCLDRSSSMGWARADWNGHLHQAPSFSLENESLPSFMDFSITSPNEVQKSANPVELPSGAGVVTVPLPDVVTLDSQNDTIEVGGGSRSPGSAPNVSPSAQDTVHSPHRDSSATEVADADRLSTSRNTTMDLPCGSSTSGPANDIKVPVNEPNGTTNLASDCSSTDIIGENMSTSVSEENKTCDMASDGTFTIALTSDVCASTGQDKSAELAHSNSLSAAVGLPDDASATVSDVASRTSNAQINASMELAGYVGNTSVTTSTQQANITGEVGGDCSSTSPAGSLNISTPAPEVNTTVDKENAAKSTTFEVGSNITVHCNTTVDLASKGGTNDVAMAVRHNSTVDLARVAATPLSTKLAKGKNTTVELSYSNSTPVTEASARHMNSTFERQSTTTGASPVNGTEVEGIVSPATVISGTLILSNSNSPSVAAIQEMSNTDKMETSSQSSSPEAACGIAMSSDKATGVNQECTSPMSDAITSNKQGSVENAPGAGNVTASDSALLAMNLSLTSEMMVEGLAPKLRLSNQFMLDDSLDLQPSNMVTSTPMPENRKFPWPAVYERIGEARKELVLPSNTNTTTADGDAPAGDCAEAAPVEAPAPCEGQEDAKASLEDGAPKATGIMLPRAARASGVSGSSVKPSELPVTRRTIPKPTCRTTVLEVCPVSNSTVKSMNTPSGPSTSNRLLPGPKAAVNNSASAQPQPAQALQKRLSLAPANLTARNKKSQNEGAVPSLNKDGAACSVRPPRASVGLKRPIPEPKGGPTKKQKEESTQASVGKGAESNAGRPPRIPTGLKKALPESSEPRRPNPGPVSKFKASLLRKKGPALPTVPEDAISTSSTHSASGAVASLVSASSVSVSSLDSTYMSEGEGHPDYATVCKNYNKLKQEVAQMQQMMEQQRQENEKLIQSLKQKIDAIEEQISKSDKNE